MLILSRKKNEALLLDGLIRLEVVSLCRSAVRLRLTAPRSLQLSGAAAARESRGRTEPAQGEGPLGVEVFHATLVNQQHLPLGQAITVAVLDADRSRALLFIDAPSGTSVATLEPDARRARRPPSEQNLLQFMSSGADRPEGSAGDSSPPPDRSGQPPSPGPPSPRLLPFLPPPAARRARG
jgi:sRNA-binding carbon storage regulator CsrA